MKTKTPMLCSLLAALAAANAQDAIPGGAPMPPPTPAAPGAPPPPAPPGGIPGMAAGGGGVTIRSTANAAPAIEVPAVRVEQITEPIRWQYRMNSDYAAPGLVNRKGPVAFLGVSASPPPSELAPHLPIDEDTGLVVEFISKDSPAEKAGLQLRDVLAKLDSQILIHPRQLAVLVANHKEGDQVKIAYVRKGQLQEANVVLGKQEPKKTLALFHSTSEDAPSADVVIYGDSESPLKTFYRRVHKAGVDDGAADPGVGVPVPGIPGGATGGVLSGKIEDQKAELQEIRKMLEDLTKRLEEGAKE